MLDDLETAFGALAATRDPDEMKPLRGEVDSWIQRYDRLVILIKERWSLLMSNLTTATQFNELYQVLVTYIVAGVVKVKEWPVIGLLPDVIRQQINSFEEFESEIAGKRHEVESVLAKGDELLSKSPTPSEDVKAKLDGVRKQWDDLEKESDAYRSQLDSTMEKAEKFKGSHDAFGAYLKEKEVDVKKLPAVGVRLEPVTEQLDGVNVLAADLVESEPRFAEMERLAVDLCADRADDDVHKREIDAMVANYRKRYGTFKTRVGKKKKTLEKAMPVVGEYNVALDELRVWLAELEPRVKELGPIGIKPDEIQKQIDEHKVYIYIEVSFVFFMSTFSF